MCNFVIRPIKSYATADTHIVDGDDVHKVKRGTAVDVLYTTADGVMAKIEEKEYLFGYDQFVHVFTANPDDVEKMRKEEHKTMGYDPNKKSK